MVDALELSGDEGRGKLRKASGRSKHPLIRGYPNGVTHALIQWCISQGEYIALRGETRGTEPSQYPEEKKLTKIPPVAASEQGRAQTVDVTASAGLQGAGYGIEEKVIERHWDGRPKRVMAP